RSPRARPPPPGPGAFFRPDPPGAQEGRRPMNDPKPPLRLVPPPPPPPGDPASEFTPERRERMKRDLMARIDAIERGEEAERRKEPARRAPRKVPVAVAGGAVAFLAAA